MQKTGVKTVALSIRGFFQSRRNMFEAFVFGLSWAYIMLYTNVLNNDFSSKSDVSKEIKCYLELAPGKNHRGVRTSSHPASERSFFLLAMGMGNYFNGR